MEYIVKFAVWFVIVYVADMTMHLGTVLLVGPIDLSHWIITLITIGINIKIFMIIDKHIKINEVPNDE